MFLSLICLVFVCAEIPTDRVAMLPGWNFPLPTTTYSGFLDATPDGEKAGSVTMHYMFVQSERNPFQDPLLVWTNGGPGLPSELGLFTSFGPLILSDQSLQTKDYNQTGVPSLFRNEWAWTNVANVLIYDSPAPVGFSYCNKPGGDGFSCGGWNDTRAALSSHKFLENWLVAFSEFSSNDLYLVGEAYGGIFVPSLARQILNSGQNKTRDTLKGFAVGAACVGTDVLCGAESIFGPWFDLVFFYGHGQMSDKKFNEIKDICGQEQLQYGIRDPQCQKLVDTFYTNLGGVAWQSGLYDECPDNLFATSHANISTASPAVARKLRNSWSQLSGALNDYPCGGAKALLMWMNTSAVQAALHCPKGSKFFVSNSGSNFNYSRTEKNLMPFYQEVNDRLRVLVYNGDADPSLNSFVVENWTIALGFKETQAWRPWTRDGKQEMGGYVTRYEGNFDFLTIRGSGRMAPLCKPQAALSMISTWLINADFKNYSL